MGADLSNVTGLEVQIKWLWQGHFRYINNLYVPDTNVTAWLLSELMDRVVDDSGWISDFADVQHTQCTLLQILGRVRGRADAGTTITRVVNQAGLVTGDPTPSWLTVNLRAIPDNANRLVVAGTPTPFKPGRMGIPGVPANSIDGATVDASILSLWNLLADDLRRIPAGVNPAISPAMSLVMTRLAGTPPVLQAKVNMLSNGVANIGTQLTAR